MLNRCLNDKEPLVSIVMPVYNVEPWVEDAVMSILRQSYENIELVAVDDGSTDRTVQKIQEIGDPRLRIIKTEHQGLFKALNIGVKTANGEWIARMDGDDIVHPDRIKTQITLLISTPGVVMCGSCYGYISPNGRIVKKDYGFENGIKMDRSFLTTGRGCADASMVFRRDIAVEEGLYDVDISMTEKSLWYKMLKRGEGFLIGSCLYFVRIRKGSSNIGQVGGAQRGRQARKRYDPKGYRHKYSGSSPPDRQLAYRQGVRTKLRIFRAAGDYKSALSCAIQSLKVAPAKAAVNLIFMAVTGRESIKLWRNCNTTVPEYVRYQPENSDVARFLYNFGIRAII